MATIFTAMISTISIGILIGVIAEDVRGAQQLVGAATSPPMSPSFSITVFVNLEESYYPVYLLMMLNPYTHFFRAIDYVILGEILEGLSSITVIGIYALFLLVISA
ncbi:MAG: hypothetical protein ABDH32_00075 [Candidatus Caldarchaeales archaeon]